MADDYDEEQMVGYKSPPKSSVFKKGHPYYPPHSRKPKKRTDQKAGRSIVTKVMQKQVRAKLDRRVKRISRFRAMLLRDVQSAINGDFDALVRVAKRGKRFGFFDLPVSQKQTGVVVIYSPTRPKEEWLAEIRAAKRAEAAQRVAIKKKG